MIRKKIFLLNTLTLIPIFLFVIYLNVTSYKKSESEAKKDISNVTQIVASENIQIVESARQLLISLSVVPEVMSKDYKCATYLSELLSKYRRYGNFGVTDIRGNLICSAIETDGDINHSDRVFFKKAIETKDYSIGEYVISRSTNKASINFGYPLLNSGGGVVFATLNLDWLDELISNLEIDKNVVVTVLDKKGVVLARIPETENLIGKEFPNDPLLSLLNEDEGLIETTGIDSKPRIYAYKEIFRGNDQGLYIVASKSKGDIAKEIQIEFIKNILISVVITAFSLIIGLFIGNSLIEKTIDKLNQLDSLRKDFISLISHQIRTPATSIKWFTEILLKDSKNKLNSRQRRILKDTHISVKRMIELIGNVLNITKLENDKIELDKKEVNLNQIVTDTLKQISKEFNSKNIKYDLVSQAKIYKLEVDEKLFFQAIYNIIHNAFKYSSKEGLAKININKSNNSIVIKIKDDGIGIPVNERDNIFAKFSRATNAKMVDTEGAGLGLYLSKLIIKAHGGDIKLGNTKTGTLVLVSIPLR
ncbi:MAG: ATP-binding protein [bacterium]|nr:MAG: ATP-binding protein [bacterium]